ncbi:MAG: hypothetical protein P4L64_16360, partial [Caulobacteraceae bacterium]|nr:hypothetical protein [Caulobacteraceae bacterium]
GPDGAGPDGAGPDGAGPDGAGMVRIHFNNRDSADGVSPLSAAKIGARRAELGAMFAFLRQTFPQARRVRGGSWLYNLEAYRRLFPPVYGQSRRIPEGAVRYSGTSSWGQMLDFRGAVRPVARDHMLAHLPDLTLEALWRAFPLRALRASAPIEAFYDFYGEAGEPAAGQRVSDQ